MAAQRFNLRYQITDAQIQDICNRHLEKPHIQHIAPMNTGLSAYTTKIEFTDHDQVSCVLRIMNPENIDTFEKELGTLLHAKYNHQIPTPKIVSIDTSGQIIDEPFFIYEYIPGEIFGKQIASLDFPRRQALYSNLGQILAKMHLDQRPEPGALFYRNYTFTFEPYNWDCSMGEFYLSGQEEDFKFNLDHGFKEKFPQLYEGCKVIWGKYKDYLLVDVSPVGFVHNDLLADNVIVREGELQAIIDWEQADYSGVLYDLARTERGLFRRIIFLPEQERSLLQRTFLDAYATIRPIEPAYFQQRVAHHLVQAMDDLCQMDEYALRLPPEYCRKIQANLVAEIAEYIRDYA